MPSGRCEFRDVERLTVRIGAQITDWDAERGLPGRTGAARPVHQFALVAARQAMAAAGIVFGDLAADGGVILGTAGGGLQTWEDNYRAVYEEGRIAGPALCRAAPDAECRGQPIAGAFGLHGPSYAVSSACSSANHAMGLAFQLIRGGAATVMLAGGSEAMLCFGGIKAWEGLRVLSRNRMPAVLAGARRDGDGRGGGGVRARRAGSCPGGAGPRYWPRLRASR